MSSRAVSVSGRPDVPETQGAPAADESPSSEPVACADEVCAQGGQITGDASSMARIGFAPIVRVDASQREIELCATSEAVDSHGTVFDYAASREAFMRWIGNVREMHERRAVGSRVAVRCDDANRRIYVRIRISRGAQDTWEKVLDGTLRGASIGASGVVWQRQRRQVAGEQRWLNVATRYDLVELSLVDNPSNPDALGISFVRDATPDVALLDVLDEPDSRDSRDDGESGDAPLAVAAGGDADASATRGQLSEPRAATTAMDRATSNRLHSAARAVLMGCGCPACAAARALLDDAPPSLEQVARSHDLQLARALASGLSENAARLNDVGNGLGTLRAALETAVERMAGQVGALSLRVGVLEGQPQPGGPVARPVEKSSAIAARGLAAMPGASEQYRALESLAGRLRDPQAQVAVAAELIRLQQQSE